MGEKIIDTEQIKDEIRKKLKNAEIKTRVINYNENIDVENEFVNWLRFYHANKTEPIMKLNK